MTDPLLQQGLDLMIYGMGTVFLFLTLLVSVTIVASAMISRFFPQGLEAETVPVDSLSSPDDTASLKSENNKKLLAILQNAIDQHRRKK